jgi:hypothetical protein
MWVRRAGAGSGFGSTMIVIAAPDGRAQSACRGAGQIVALGLGRLAQRSRGALDRSVRSSQPERGTRCG